MKSKYSVENIKINYNTDTKDYSPFVVQKIEEFFNKLQKNKIHWKVVEDLQKIIAKFPKVPTFKNYLATAYDKLNRENDLKNILLKTIKDHPDYILGKITLAKFYLDRDEIDLAERSLGYAENISDLSSEQETFHSTEVQFFYYFLALIELKKNNDQNTEEILQLLYSINTDERYTDDLHQRLVMHTLQNFQDEDALEPVPEKVILKDSSKERPVLHNKELYTLYHKNLHLSDTFIDEVKSLERNSVIDDLRKLLKDAENRYHYFLSSGTDQLFPIHALLLLRELKAEEALEDVLDFLSNEEDFLEFWLDDFLTEYSWEIIFVLSESNRKILKDFLLKPGVYSFSKGAVLSAMVQASFEDADILEMWNECLSLYAKAKEEDNIISKEFFSMFVIDIFPFDKENFRENIERLFDKGWINEKLTGDFEKLDRIDKPSQKNITELADIFKMYS